MTEFWCHGCGKVVMVGAEMVCPECQGEFVEMIERPEQQLPDEQGQSSSPNTSPRYQTIELREFFPLQDATAYEEQGQQPTTLNGNNAQSNRQSVLLPYSLQGQNLRQIPFMLQVRMDNPQNLTNVLNQLLGQLAGRLTNFGDYVPDNALQAILDQLYLQYRPPTQPRTSEKVIASLPIIKLTEDNIKDLEECPVCKCDFEVGEESKELPCSHHYHTTCINRWLTSSNLCPLCRYELEKEEPTNQTEGSSIQTGSTGEEVTSSDREVSGEMREGEGSIAQEQERRSPDEARHRSDGSSSSSPTNDSGNSSGTGENTDYESVLSVSSPGPSSGAPSPSTELDLD